MHSSQVVGSIRGPRIPAKFGVPECGQCCRASDPRRHKVARLICCGRWNCLLARLPLPAAPKRQLAACPSPSLETDIPCPHRGFARIGAPFIQMRCAISSDSNNLHRPPSGTRPAISLTIVRRGMLVKRAWPVLFPVTHILRRRDAPRGNMRFG